MKKITSIFALTLTCIAFSHARGNDDISKVHVGELYKKSIITTPDMAQLIHNIKYPINYSTGTVNIKIPLFTIECGTLSIPFYLTYDTSGVKVNSGSGWVGQNWMLNGIPTISRQINGHIDPNLECPFDPKRYAKKSYEENYMHIKALLANNIYNKGVEEQPDEYFFNLGEQSGMFMYCLQPEAGYPQYMTIPYSNIKIETDENKKHFILTDANGTIYNFCGGYDRTYAPSDIYETGRKVSTIKAANSLDSIVFTYNGKLKYEMEVHNDSYTVIDNIRAIGFGDEYLFTQNDNYWDVTEKLNEMDFEELVKRPVVIKTTNQKTEGFQVDGAYDKLKPDQRPYDPMPLESHVVLESDILSAIHFKGNVIEFQSSDLKNHGRLEKITMKNYLGKVVKTITFEYLPTSSYRSRTYLSAVTFLSENREKITYKFTYDNPVLGGDFGNRCMDFWGYFNGRYNESTLVPKMKLQTRHHSYNKRLEYVEDSLMIGHRDWDSRATDEAKMKIGSLTSITYPTGVRDSFIFEANQIRLIYDPEFETDFHFSEHLLKVPYQKDTYQIGGLRIKQIISKTSEGDTNVRSFKYNDDGTGCSPIQENYNYFVTHNTKYYENITLDQSCWYANARHRTYFCSPILPITYENGASAMYNKVTEYMGTEQDNEGYVIYEYEVPSYKQGAPGGELRGIINEYKYQDWQYGNLNSKTIFSMDGSIVERERYGYSKIGPKGKIYSSQYHFYNIFNYDILQKLGNGVGKDIEYQKNNDYFSIDYNIYAHELTNTVHEVYTEEGITKEATTYDYTDDYANLPKRESLYENGELRKEESYEYPHTKTEVVYREMTNRHILNPTITTTYSYYGDLYNPKGPIRVTTPYENVSGNENAPIFMPIKTVYDYGTHSETRLTRLYNNLGQVVQTTKDGKETETYVYGYNNLYIIGVIQNATLSEVGTYLPSITDIANRPTPLAYWDSLLTLQQSLSNTQVYLYQYEPLIGICTEVKPNGLTLKYLHDGFGRLVKKEILRNGKTEKIESYQYKYKR